MIGFIFAIIAGISMTVQGIFNTRVSEKLGTWQTNILVQGTALLLAMLVFFIVKPGNFTEIKNVNKIYLTGGIFAVIITFTVMEAMKKIGITATVSTILIAQLTSASLIDCLGIFQASCTKLDVSKIIGVLVMIAGILLFKYKG